MNLIQKFVDSKMSVFQGMDSEYLEVEHIRSFFGIPRKAAEFICEKAVAEGYFERWTGLLNPDTGRIIEYHKDGDKPPTEPIEDLHQVLDEAEKTSYYLDELEKIIVYRVLK